MALGDTFPTLPFNERSCSSRTLFSNSSWAAYEGDNIFGWEFSVFDCNRSDVSDAYAELNVRIQELNGELHLPDIPHLWVSNKLDTFNRSSEAGSNESQVMKSVVPWRSPSWRLRPGFHLSADAGFVTRRFVTSSIFHDVILQKEPAPYEPIPQMITLQLLRQFHYRFNKSSIGGLFALLQSLHVLLFGRPMLWGLTGAKLITPFGLLGQFSTKKFKERLSQQYHRLEPASGPHPGDAAEDIRLGAFLRDFVIEFGPADTEDTPERSNTEAQPADTHQPTESGQSEIPLLPMPYVGRLSIEDNFIGNENTPSVSNDMGGRV
ncbi:hypothetical protein BDV93DRAFT_588464 [Ceratobasidium sp. AG-I]|nr:hypothetical protein BDV93DRAFT_588464 [Ceratobasidium sp. AG-I]